MGPRVGFEDVLSFLSLGIDLNPMEYPMSGKYSGLIFVCGSARCIWDDLEKAGLAKNDDTHFHIMAINDLIMHYPSRVEHAYSNNHKYLKRWIDARRDQFVTRWEPIKHTHSNKIGGKHTWPWPGHGTSSLNAVYTAIALGYTDIRLCGIPLDNTGHYFEPHWMKTNFQAEVGVRDGRMKYWHNAKDKIFEGKVTSYSGRTKELLNP